MRIIGCVGGLKCYVCVSCGFDESNHNPVVLPIAHQCGGNTHEFASHDRCYVSIPLL